MSRPFVHLRLHTEYSLVDSVVRIAPLMARARELGMPAVAMTDAGNLFALVKFYRAAEAAGIKPIIGVDLNLALAAGEPAGVVTALVCGREGYRTLCQLVTRSYAEGQHAGRPEVKAGWLGDGVPELLLLAGRESPIAAANGEGSSDRAHERLEKLRQLFPHGVYLELTRTDRPGEEPWNRLAVTLAAATNTPAVATNDVRFLASEDFEAHEARVAIHQGYRLTDARRARGYSREQYLKSGEEMAERFADLPEALAASVAIAERASFALDLGHPVLPAFPAPDGESEEALLRREAETGLARRIGASGFKPAASKEDYRARLAHELEVIFETGFPGYFLIVADFIAWARANGVPVGPGRGSGAGSLVAWALGITDLDPLAYGLLFERFLNPERVSMPDFDVDFCMEGRDRVIEYVADRYGRERVSQIITYGTMAARAVVRDTGRVLGHPYGLVDKIAKLVPFELGMTLERALAESEELAQVCRDEEEVGNLIALARKLEGLPRNAGKHAGGVVIAPGELNDFTPLYAEANGANLVTQLDKDDVEAIGLVKFDFLGLRTLTIIDWAVKAINARRAQAGDVPLEMSALPLDDAAVYEQVFQQAQTAAVFQFESPGMQRLLKEAKPDRFEDIIALNALYRPGPMDLIPSFLARKLGREPVSYPDPRVEPILKETYGIMVYQEQVMQMAQIVGGYTLGGADLLRRAMGKKKVKEMVKQRGVFRAGAAKNGLSEQKADRIFDLMEKFAGYGFNKSHSTAYALLAYQTAWLKTYYPAAYMAAVLSADMDHTEKVVPLIGECRRMGLDILPPHVNHSDYPFKVEGERAIRYGLGAIKGLGRGAVEALVAERARGGAFESLADLCARGDPGRLNRRALEALIEAGALDGLAPHRAALLRNLPIAIAAAEQRQRAGASGQNDFFGQVTPPRLALAAIAPWDESERLTREKRILGLYLSGHPLRAHAKLLSKLGAAPIGELPRDPPASGQGAAQPVRVVGLVADLRRFGRRTVVTLEDEDGRIEVTCFDDVAERARPFLTPDRIVVADGRLGWDNYFKRWRVTVENIAAIETVAEREAGCVWIEWRPNGEAPAECAARLGEILRRHGAKGKTGIAMRYHGKAVEARIRFGNDWRIVARRELLAGLKELPGVERVEVIYRPRTLSAPQG
jgi:DNA polymerase-3 subunit alpha